MARSDKSATYIVPEIAAYLVDHTSPPDDLLEELVAETRRVAPDRMTMQIDAEQGVFLTMLTRLLGARRVVEVGTFTGYSSICFARGLAADGRLLCLDVNEEWTAVARRFWKEAGVAERIELVLGPAADTLGALPDEEVFDLAFIDADKGGYQTYYQEIMKRLRPGGLIIVDNVLWSGRVVDPSVDTPDTVTMREFNDMVMADDRVTSIMLPMGDGLTLINKNP